MIDMQNGQVTLYGMSSLDEYWNRASEIDRSEIKTSSSDDSTDDTKSSDKEYRDASCYVDFDEEFNEIVNEDATNNVQNSWEIIKLSETKLEESFELQSSRYVRWDVLASLGLGLWAVLCIVDFLHSGKSVTEGWFYESAREEKNVSKTLLVKRPETEDWGFIQVWPYLRRFLWISSSGGLYILLILLLIVFCVDPRLRKSTEQATIKNSSNTRNSQKEAKNSIVENKTFRIRKKVQNSRVIRPVIQKVVPIKLVLNPAIHLHAKILSGVDQRLSELKNIQTRNSVVKRKIASVSTILQTNNGQLSEYRKFVILNRTFLGQLRITNCKTLQFLNINRKNAYSCAKELGYLIDSSTSCCNVENVHFELEEYLRRTRKPLNSFNSFRTRSIEAGRNFTDLSTNGNIRTRIITSSPAFKNFLLRLKHNSCVS